MTDSALRWHTALQTEHKPLCITYFNALHTVEPQAKVAHINTIGDLMIETLSNWGIQQVFGVIEASNLGLNQSLYTQEKNGNIRCYSTRHESAAAFAASTYAKLTGRPAACVAGTNPSATRLLDGLWDAKLDKAPIVALTGQTETPNEATQWSQVVQHDSDHAELANLACKNAILNRGVSHLIFPDAIPKRLLAEPMLAGSPKGRLPSQSISPPEDALHSAIELLRASERPVIVVGRGAHGCMDSVIQLAEQLRAPVITTFKGKGQIPDNHSLAGGVLGPSGTPVANWLMDQADVLLIFGASLNKHSGITTKRPIIQVDHDLTALARFQAVDAPVWGDISVTAQTLSNEFLGDMWTQDQTIDIAAQWANWRADPKNHSADDCIIDIRIAALFEALSNAIDDDAIIAIDDHNNNDAFARDFECKQQTILMPSDSDAIGFALPAAMGAWSATLEDDPKFKSRQVISISSADGFDEHLSEINTAVEYNMNITSVVISNTKLSNFDSKQSTSNEYIQYNSSLADYANSCGAMGIRITQASELDAALKKALSFQGPALLEVIVAPPH